MNFTEHASELTTSLDLATKIGLEVRNFNGQKANMYSQRPQHTILARVDRILHR